MDTWRAIRRWTPILMFHEVVPDDGRPLPPYAVTRATLRAILADFARRGYHAGSLDDALPPAPGRPRAGGQRLVLTFDDGTRDFLEQARPVLDEFGFTATLFIVAGLLGGMRAWRDQAGTRPLPPVPLLTAAELRELAAAGFTIGAHTLTHPALPALPPAAARREIAGARAALQEVAGQPVDWFAYPYTATSPAVEALIAEAGYRGACGGYHGAHRRYFLNRLDGSVFTLPQLRLRSSGLVHWARQRRAARPAG